MKRTLSAIVLVATSCASDPDELSIRIDTGVIHGKLDGDARGGAALSVRQVTGQPILFASNGEKLEDFDLFHPDRMASRILGMGDVLSLIEQAEQHFDQEKAEQTAAKLGSGQLTLEDFLEQMLAVRKMGSIGNLLGMLPGAGQMKDQLAHVDVLALHRGTHRWPEQANVALVDVFGL